MKYFSYEQFLLGSLIRKKNKSNTSVGLALPVLNEEKTLKETILTIRKCNKLIDKLIVVDSGSTDNSKKICKEMNVKFVDGKEIARKLNRKYTKGKGWNLWASLYCLDTDIIIWIDSDIQNISTRFITGIVGPMLMDFKIKFVKGYYRRPKGDARVTEIMARPFLNCFFPKLKNVIQPLSGEYGGRRSFLERVVFYSGYSVEIAVLVQALYSLKEAEVAQSYLGKRIHELQDVPSLGRMSASIFYTLLKLSEDIKFIEVKTKVSGKLRQFNSSNKKNFSPVDIYIKDTRLPKMISMSAYHKNVKK